jgi:hypothetical protein
MAAQLQQEDRCEDDIAQKLNDIQEVQKGDAEHPDNGVR